MRLFGPAAAGAQEVTFTAHDDEALGVDAPRVKLDDTRAVSDAGVMLVGTLANRLGIEELAGQLVRLRDERPGAASGGRRVMALLFAMVLGADCIDDTEALRSGRTRPLNRRDDCSLTSGRPQGIAARYPRKGDDQRRARCPLLRSGAT